MAIARPGPYAKAFFRCVLFASVTNLCALVLAGLFVSPLCPSTFVRAFGKNLQEASLNVAAILVLPLFVLSWGFMFSERRLSLAGFLLLALFLVDFFLVVLAMSQAIE